MESIRTKKDYMGKMLSFIVIVLATIFGYWLWIGLEKNNQTCFIVGVGGMLLIVIYIIDKLCIF